MLEFDIAVSNSYLCKQDAENNRGVKKEMRKMKNKKKKWWEKRTIEEKDNKIRKQSCFILYVTI